MMITAWLLALLAFLAAATVHSAPNPAQADHRLVCYFTNWVGSREGPSRFTPNDIDPSLCTNIIYSFATLNEGSLEIQVADENTDINQGLYAQVTALKSDSLKVSIAIGGWGDSGTDKYSRMVSTAQGRTNFVNSVLAFIQEHNFDGLDLDWEYPKCPWADCSGPDSDRPNFALLVAELKAAFAPHGYLLSAAVSASRYIGDNAYDVTALSENLDWIGLMTYDYHGGYDGVTGHNSPFKGQPPNNEDTVDYWLERGAPADKLVLGVPLYGRSFTLQNAEENWVGAAATDGEPAQYTGEAGFIAYFELCTGWTYRNVAGVGPYAFRGDQWASFDDVAIIEQKTAFIKERGLGGALVWAIDLDDFSGGFCGQGRYPLLSTLRKNL